MTLAALLVAVLLTVACELVPGGVPAEDPVERGLSYVAAAIIGAAAIRAVFNH